jgi:hypothetical protein
MEVEKHSPSQKKPGEKKKQKAKHVEGEWKAGKEKQK